MSGSQDSRRAVAEIRSGGNPMAGARIGNRSIHQFWYLYAPYFRHVLLAPHRRPDSDQVSWSWSEAANASPPTAAEMAEVRRRLTDANQALADGLADLDSANGGAGGGTHGLESQVRASLQELISQLCAKSDPGLGGFVCRTPHGLMLHSWGASTAAVPYYPDSRQGGINGTVWLDGRPAGGVKVVLRNKQGADLAHATTGRDGAFGFPQVAPGQYRVRVAGRDDFPAEGEAVTVGHETVGGLELRGGSSGPAEDRSPAGSSSASRRWWLAGLALLALLGAGGFGWRHLTKPEAAAAGGEKTPYSWQTASGKLVGSSGREPAADAPKSGGAGAWADLSRTPAPPKSLKTPPLSKAKDHVADDRAPAPSVPALAGPSLRVPGEKSAPKDGAETNLLFRPDAKPLLGTDPAGTTAGEPTHPDALATAAAARAEPVEADARPQDNQTTGPDSASAARRRPLVSGNNPSPPDNPPAEAGPSGGINQTRADSFSAIPQGASRSARTARSAGPDGSGTADPSSVPATAAGSGLPASASSAGGGDESTDQVQARSGAKAKERAGLARATVTTTTTLTASAGEETKENDEPAASETDHDKTQANTTARTGLTAIRPSGIPSPPPGKVSPAGRTGGESASAPDVPVLTESMAKPATAAETVRPPQGLAPASAGPAGDDARGDGPWVPLGRVSASAWQTRLVRDLVLPTLPVPEGEDDALEALQAGLLRERKAQLPPAFRQPVTASGLAFELPSGETGRGGPLRWRDATGADIAGSTVQGNRAELAWAGMNAPRGTDHVLGDATGREYVRVSLDQGGVPRITARPGVRTWYWVGIEHAAAAPGPAEPRLIWRLLAGTADASGWPRDNRWRAGRGQRIDLPLGSDGVGPGCYALALVDPVTGWAIACDLTLR